FDNSGAVIATSSTTTTRSATSTPLKITNTFNFTIPAAGNYSIGIYSGLGNLGFDNPSFPLTEPSGTIRITGVSHSGHRILNSIRFNAYAGSSTAPRPSTAVVGSTQYTVTQAADGCVSPPATITVNVAVLAISQTPTSGLIADYEFAGN